MFKSRFVPVLGCSLVIALTATMADEVDAEQHVARWSVTPETDQLLQQPTSNEPSTTQFPAAALDPALRIGWPVDLQAASGAAFPYTPTLFDADSDGADEIFLTGGHTFGLRGDGSFLPGWPTAEMLHNGYGTNGNKPGPSVADFDGDPNAFAEVLWSERDWWAGSSRMWCFNAKYFDGNDYPQFPQLAPDDPSNALDTPFVVGDADGDGDLEVWGAHTLGNNFTHYRVSAFDHLGNRLFTVDLDPDENIKSLYFGDLDGDGAKEMFAVSWLGVSFWLHVFEADGTEAPGYPIVLQTFTWGTDMNGPPVPADLDGDGDLEIMLARWGSAASLAYCVHHDGTPCAGYPLQIATSSQLFYIGLGDLTGDGDPELLAFDNHLGGNYRAHALDLATGTSLSGWPFDLLHWPKGFPTVVDVDNDGIQDVCIGTDGGEVLAVSGDGQLISGYPHSMVSPSISGVAAGDIDDDGLFELVAATWDGWVYAWDTVGEVLPGRADWPMRGVDARNTGVFGATGTTTALLGESPPPRLVLEVRPNPVLHSAEFLFETGRLPARLEIYDASGRLVEELNTVDRHRLIWRPGSSRASGIYFARLTEPGASEVVRFVVLR